MAFLLLLPFIGLLWVPFYNQTTPVLFGFPFFYWYQIAWVPVSSLITFFVWRSRVWNDNGRNDNCRNDIGRDGGR